MEVMRDVVVDAGAFTLAVGGSALATALAVLLLSAIDDWPGVDPALLAGFFLLTLIFATVVIAAAALLIGLPLTWLCARRRIERAWTYPLAGFLAGAALVVLTPVLIGTLDAGEMLEFLPFAWVGALPGALCGAIWWRVHRRHEAAGG